MKSDNVYKARILYKPVQHVIIDKDKEYGTIHTSIYPYASAI